MQQKLYAYCLLIGLAFSSSCSTKRQTNHQSDYPDVNDLITYAECQDTSLEKRLYYALLADSAAEDFGDSVLSLKVSKVIGVLYLEQKNTIKAKGYFIKSLRLASKSNDLKTQALVLNNIGTIFHTRADYDSALVYYLSANNIYKELNDRYNEALSLVNIGIIYKEAGIYDLAFEYTYDAAGILDSLKENRYLATTFNSMGNILSEMNRLDDALSFHTKAMNLRVELRDSMGIAASMNNIGNIYKKRKQYDTALSFYKNSLKLKESLGMTGATATTVNNIAEIYRSMGAYSISETYYREALNSRLMDKNVDGVMTSANGLSRLYLATNNVSGAEQIALLAYNRAPVSGLLKQRLDNHIILSEIFSRESKLTKAIYHKQKALELKDSIFNADMAQIVSGLQIRYKTKKIEQELTYAKNLQHIQGAQISTQRTYILLLAALALMLLIISYLVFRLSQQRKRAKLKVDTLMAELNHRVKNNLQLVSDILQLQTAISDNDSEKQTIKTLKNRVQSINIVHSLLYSSDYTGKIDMKTFFSELILNLTTAYEEKSKDMDIQLAVGNITLNVNTAIPIGLIANELVTNIFKHATGNAGQAILKLSLDKQSDEIILYITDNFSYWDKEKAKEASKGLGLFLVETLTKQLNGSWLQSSTPDGTIHTLKFKI